MLFITDVKSVTNLLVIDRASDLVQFVLFLSDCLDSKNVCDPGVENVRFANSATEFSENAMHIN